MTRHTITRESLRQAGACWTNDQIASVVPEEGLPVTHGTLDAMIATGIDPVDLQWALVYAAGAYARVLREHACWCARQALSRVDTPDPRSVRAVEVAERYARGEATEDELRDAWESAAEAAEAAAYAAAEAAAYAAARSAAYAAARSAAYAADWAARSAAMVAAWAARAVTRADQCRDLVRRICAA